MDDLKTIKDKVNFLRVMIVDDEDQVREGIIVFMKKFFAYVDGAENGEEALRKFRENGPYDIVLTDIHMPKTTGWKLIEELKSLYTELFVAVMTGSPEMNDKIKKSCDIYMSKPIDINKMQVMLEMIIQKKGL